MKRIIVALLLSTALFSVTACEVPDDSGTAADRTDTKDAASKDAKPKGNSTKKAKPDAPKETASQAQARGSAEQYLDVTAFSREGLIDQLVNGESFSKADATYGVDAQKADWKQQAALSAKQYLDISNFSHAGLVDQLVNGDKYTKAEAEFGVNKVGL